MKYHYILAGFILFGALVLSSGPALAAAFVPGVLDPAGSAGGGGVAAPDKPDKITQLKAQAAQSLNRVSFGSLAEIVGQVILFEIFFLGMIAFVLYLYAGILWMGAMGNSEQIEKAKNIILWTTMGVGATLASSIFARFLFHDVLKVI